MDLKVVILPLFFFGYSCVSPFYLTLCVCFYALNKVATSPGLEDVALCGE